MHKIIIKRNSAYTHAVMALFVYPHQSFSLLIVVLAAYSSSTSIEELSTYISSTLVVEIDTYSPSEPIEMLSFYSSSTPVKEISTQSLTEPVKDLPTYTLSSPTAVPSTHSSSKPIASSSLSVEVLFPYSSSVPIGELSTDISSISTKALPIDPFVVTSLLDFPVFKVTPTIQVSPTTISFSSDTTSPIDHEDQKYNEGKVFYSEI